MRKQDSTAQITYVVDSTPAWHSSGPGSMLGQGSYGIFYVQNMALNIGDCESLMNRRIALMSVIYFQFGTC